jgi:hypothetical protein
VFFGFVVVMHTPKNVTRKRSTRGFAIATDPVSNRALFFRPYPLLKPTGHRHLVQTAGRDFNRVILYQPEPHDPRLLPHYSLFHGFFHFPVQFFEF